jgi:hypothetical protein
MGDDERDVASGVADGPPPVHVDRYSASPDRSPERDNTVSPLGSPVSAERGSHRAFFRVLATLQKSRSLLHPIP